MPNKPVKRGVGACSYFSQLEMYTGKKWNAMESGLELRAVKDLIVLGTMKIGKLPSGIIIDSYS